ncbi:MAG: LysR family transcriptional regulator [Bacilli bacterium]|nr:LysR family transcriptional regulator [Bacilli bacterium]
MDYNLYKIFLYLYEEKSISKTASKLYVSQPAISYSLKELETSLGYTLFNRNSKGIEPTIEATELYNYIKTAFNILNDAEEHVKNLNNLNVGNIKIGVPSHIGMLVLVEYVEQFRKTYPNVKFSIISKPMPEMIEMLETRKLDIVIGINPIHNEKNLTKLNIRDLHNCFVYNKTLLTDIRIRKESDLLKYPLILPNKSLISRIKLDNYMETKNIRLSECIEVDTTEIALEMVKKGMGIGYFIEDIIKLKLNKEDYEVISFDDLPITNISLLYINEYTSIAAKKFINTFKKN